MIDSLGRITSEAVIAKNILSFLSFLSNGWLCCKVRRYLRRFRKNPEKKLKIGEQSVLIDTGDPLPEGFNGVIMIEDVNPLTIIRRDTEFREIVQLPGGYDISDMGKVRFET